MKNLLFVSVALSVFTVTPLAILAQPKNDFFKDNYAAGDYRQYETKEINFSNTQKTFANLVKKTPVTLVATELCNAMQFKFAQLLDRDVETITNISLYSFIEDWWAVRYRYGGTTKRGVDCSSYTSQLISATFGIILPRTARAQYGVTTRVKKDELQEGDLVFFNTRGGVSHVGVYLGDSYFTHSSCSSGVTISSLNDAYYSRKFISGGRFQAVENTAVDIETVETIESN
jgi:hypothetical protein